MAKKTIAKKMAKAISKKGKDKSPSRTANKPAPAAKKAATAKPTTTTTEVVSEVFTTNPPVPENVVVAPNTTRLYVNGTSRGMIDTANTTVKDFVIAQASNHGVRTFSVYLDGKKADTSDGQRSMSGIAKVEIVAKDARG